MFLRNSPVEEIFLLLNAKRGEDIDPHCLPPLLHLHSLLNEEAGNQKEKKSHRKRRHCSSSFSSGESIRDYGQ